MLLETVDGRPHKTEKPLGERVPGGILLGPVVEILGPVLKRRGGGGRVGHHTLSVSIARRHVRS